MNEGKLGLIVHAIFGLLVDVVVDGKPAKKPTVKDIELMVGFDITAADRDEAWDLIQADPESAKQYGIKAMEEMAPAKAEVSEPLKEEWVSIKTKGVETRTRAGMRWTRKAKVVDLGGFTPAQDKALKSDPYLVVTPTEAPSDKPEEAEATEGAAE